MKTLLFIILFFTFSHSINAQQNYCDFEGPRTVTFGYYNGILDSMFTNTFPNSVDTSNHCAKYIRDTALYDNIKLYPIDKLVDISPYMNNSSSAPKIKLKLYTTAPVGTVIQIQLGSKSDNNYPSGINSEFIALTTVQNEWENVTLHYFQSPIGTLSTPTNIDKIILMFHPNSNSRDTIYFDELTGPALISPTGILGEKDIYNFKLYPNTPNPAKGITHIDFLLNNPGATSLIVYDMLGNPVSTIVDQYMKAGSYSIPFETVSIPNGIYFYVLKKDGVAKSMKMIVSK
jgi:hypothetical protein